MMPQGAAQSTSLYLHLKETRKRAVLIQRTERALLL